MIECNAQMSMETRNREATVKVCLISSVLRATVDGDKECYINGMHNIEVALKF